MINVGINPVPLNVPVEAIGGDCFVIGPEAEVVVRGRSDIRLEGEAFEINGARVRSGHHLVYGDAVITGHAGSTVYVKRTGTLPIEGELVEPLDDPRTRLVDPETTRLADMLRSLGVLPAIEDIEEPDDFYDDEESDIPVDADSLVPEPEAPSEGDTEPLA